MHKFLISAVALFAGVSAWTQSADAGLLSSKGPVIAILGGERYTGEAVGYLDGSGTVRIQSEANSDLSCRGRFTSSAELGGMGSLECTDGVIVTFAFRRLSIRRGHGTGTSARGPLSFTYGLTPAEAAPYLKAPPA